MTPAQAGLVHSLFEWAAIFVGARLYLRRAATDLRGVADPRQYAVVVGCLFGAGIGNKAVHWIHHAERWPLLEAQPWLLLQGQSIVGGLLGGLVGVEIGKQVAGVTTSTGDRFVDPILAGLVIGRVGCFLAGLHDDTYGVATNLPWGYDFGDGVARHPAQLYDILYAALAWYFLRRAQPSLTRIPGLQFKLLLVSYLLWRLAVDGLKPVPYTFVGGLSGIQLVCVVGMLLYLPLALRQLRRPAQRT